MNGINYNALMGNSGLYSNQSSSILEDAVKNAAAAGAKAAEKKTDNRQANADKDTYEHSTGANKAGYSRPSYIRNNTKTETETKYKALDADGVQEGIELSDKAKAVLKELKEKYGDQMEIAVAEWSSDDEQDYYASLTDKAYSVLINPELLEQMANDDEVKQKYMDVLGGADDKFSALKEGLGEDAERIKGFSITIDADGEVSYAVKLMKDIAESSRANSEKTQEERIEERREARKKAEKERLEKVEAESIEELIEAVKKKLHPETVEKEDENVEEQEAEKVVIAEAGMN